MSKRVATLPPLHSSLQQLGLALREKPLEPFTEGGHNVIGTALRCGGEERRRLQLLLLATSIP